jgi:hypothetical protein
MNDRTEGKSLPSLAEHAYATWLWLDERVATFPTDARRQMGHRILDATLDALAATVEATYARRPPTRAAKLELVSLRLTVLRILLRGARDRRWLSIAQHEHAMQLVDDWGRQVGGWLRSLRAPGAP